MPTCAWQRNYSDLFVFYAAKADDPVFQDASDGIESVRRYREHVAANEKRLSSI
jgi:hypothetical protein